MDLVQDDAYRLGPVNCTQATMRCEEEESSEEVEGMNGSKVTEREEGLNSGDKTLTNVYSELDLLAMQVEGATLDELNTCSDTEDHKKVNLFLQNGCTGSCNAEVMEDNSLDILNGTVLENADFKLNNNGNKTLGDGSDSGVEVNSCCCGGGHGSSPALLRAFSNNSGGYTSSCGGLEDSMTANTTPAVSCDSSLISCYSTYEDTEDIVTSTTMLLLQGGDGTSEGGSESSSVTGKDSSWHSKNNNSKKSATSSGGRGRKRAEATRPSTDSTQKNISPVPTPIPSPRPRASTSRQQTSVTPRTTLSSSGTAFGRSSTTSSRKEKMSTGTTSSVVGVKSGTVSKQCVGVSNKPLRVVPSVSVNISRGHSKALPDSSVFGVCRKEASTSVLKAKSAGKIISRSKVTSSGISDDGRWPSLSNRSQSATQRSRGGSLVEGQCRKTPVSATNGIAHNSIIMESKASALEKYATLPRRRRHKSPESQATDTHHRSHSVSRDPSLNRAASLRKQHHMKEGSISGKSLPPYPRRRMQGKTRIYHEISMQTTLTGDDVANALAGVGVKEYIPVGIVEMLEQEVQVDERNEELERLEARMRQLASSHAQLQVDCDRQRQELGSAEQQLKTEKEEKLALKEELEQTTQRVLAILENVKGDIAPDNGTDSLQELETQIQSSGHVVIKQQQEITDLQTLCRTLQRDLEKSLAAQKTLLQQQQEIEAESTELQEFLQAEKSTLADALREAETEISAHRQQLIQRELDLQRQQEECKHLVRISEQRRQENLALQARLSGLEQRSKELLLQQGAAVSGAAVALSGLSSRLDGLVEQLVAAYDISEKDLEDVIFHNEAYSKSNSSIEASPEKVSAICVSEQSTTHSQRTPSPKRGASFVTAVISAIRNAAAQSPFSSSAGKRMPTPGSTPSPQDPLQDSSPGAAELLDSEMDPCIVVENDEDDAGNSHQHCSDIPQLANSESLQNLSEAILIRQQSELAHADGSTSSDDVTTVHYEGSEDIGDYCPAVTLVDQIIDVDNLVTRLLKVLRILQLENETCIDELHDERVQLAEQVRREQENRREVQDELRNWEHLGARLRSEVQDARLQLQHRIQELEKTRADLEHHRDQVEHLSQDVCNLSSLCQQAELQLQSREEEAEALLQQWQDTGHLPSGDTLARIITARNEIPALKQRLAEKEEQLKELGQNSSMSKQLLTENWHQAIQEVRRQYEAIDSALETLQSIQGIVVKCPPLAKLQQELEETNFHCITSLPVVGADLNANAALMTANGTHNSGSNGLDAKLNAINPRN